MFGERYGLPAAISAHNNYYVWGTRGYTGQVVIIWGSRAENTTSLFDSIQQVASMSTDRAPISENHFPIYVCRRLKVPLVTIWPSLRHFE